MEESKFPPSGYPLQITVFSYREAFKGGIVGKITAVDKDPYDTLQYTIGSPHYLSNDIEYFDVDGQDGTLVAITPLDDGKYRVNVSISDGKFTRSVNVDINVLVFSEEMVDNAILVTMGPITPEQFLTRYRTILVKVLAAELIENEEHIYVLSLQNTIHHIPGNGKIERISREIRESLDILLVIKKRNDHYYSRNELMTALQARRNRIHRKLSLQFFEVMKPVCTSDIKCSNQGKCVDDIVVNEDIILPINTRLNSIVAPVFKHIATCQCNQGYDGKECEHIINVCGHQPCPRHHICSATNINTKGYLCYCSKGFTGKYCQLNISKCNDLSCYYPAKPLSFMGRSYVQYSVSHLEESDSMQLSLFLRTRHPVGVISFISGIVDYSILEVIDGIVQYRWECGSGEGIVQKSNQRVDDGEWHLIDITREGTVAILSVDGGKSSSVSPGQNDILNINSEFMYFGAQISFRSTATNIDYGFVGCLDQITLDGKILQLSLGVDSNNESISLKKLIDVEPSCPNSLPAPGICGKQPCDNGGTCIELGSDRYKCSCLPKYSGKRCQVDEAPCSSSPCLNSGKCIESKNTFSCECSESLSGRRCEYGVHCNPNPCENRGRCEEGVRGPICKCHNFFGDRCQYDIDECTRNPCQNEGTCLNFVGGFSCLCGPSFTGKYCNVIISQDEPGGFRVSFKDVLIVFAAFIAFSVFIVIIGAWQRKKWKEKREQQNNHLKPTEHVKNDLSSADRTKRNSKICNVEADQVSCYCVAPDTCK